jgi:hypothetical protein
MLTEDDDDDDDDYYYFNLQIEVFYRTQNKVLLMKA